MSCSHSQMDWAQSKVKSRLAPPLLLATTPIVWVSPLLHVSLAHFRPHQFQCRMSTKQKARAKQAELASAGLETTTLRWWRSRRGGWTCLDGRRRFQLELGGSAQVLRKSWRCRQGRTFRAGPARVQSGVEHWRKRQQKTKCSSQKRLCWTARNPIRHTNTQSHSHSQSQLHSHSHT